MFPRLSQVRKKVVQRFDLDKQVIVTLENWLGPRQGADRINQVGSGIGSSTSITAVAVLIRFLTARTSAGDKSIGQENSLVWIIQLSHFFFVNKPSVTNRLPELST